MTKHYVCVQDVIDELANYHNINDGTMPDIVYAILDKLVDIDGPGTYLPAAPYGKYNDAKMTINAMLTIHDQITNAPNDQQ